MKETILVNPPAAAASGGLDRAQTLTLSGTSTAASQLNACWYTFYATTDCHVAFSTDPAMPAALTTDWLLPAGSERSYFMNSTMYFRAIQDVTGGVLWFYRSGP
jgi:hypothetical protein